MYPCPDGLKSIIVCKTSGNIRQLNQLLSRAGTEIRTASRAEANYSAARCSRLSFPSVKYQKLRLALSRTNLIAIISTIIAYQLNILFADKLHQLVRCNMF